MCPTLPKRVRSQGRSHRNERYRIRRGGRAHPARRRYRRVSYRDRLRTWCRRLPRRSGCSRVCRERSAGRQSHDRSHRRCGPTPRRCDERPRICPPASNGVLARTHHCRCSALIGPAGHCDGRTASNGAGAASEFRAADCRSVGKPVGPTQPDPLAGRSSRPRRPDRRHPQRRPKFDWPRVDGRRLHGKRARHSTTGRRHGRSSRGRHGVGACRSG